jgi:hypothetical protein
MKFFCPIPGRKTIVLPSEASAYPVGMPMAWLWADTRRSVMDGTVRHPARRRARTPHAVSHDHGSFMHLYDAELRQEKGFP